MVWFHRVSKSMLRELLCYLWRCSIYNKSGCIAMIHIIIPINCIAMTLHICINSHHHFFSQMMPTFFITGNKWSTSIVNKKLLEISNWLKESKPSLDVNKYVILFYCHIWTSHRGNAVYKSITKISTGARQKAEGNTYRYRFSINLMLISHQFRIPSIVRLYL